MSDRKNDSVRKVILIAHALVWAAAMVGGSFYFKDRPWGEDLFLWMIVGFTLANGLLTNTLGGANRRC
ncbi:MAG: hypothetical protein ACE5FO_01440 [Parvularculaceae bacterium]